MALANFLCAICISFAFGSLLVEAATKTSHKCPSRFPNSTKCGSVSVPLNHARPNSKRIDVHYALLKPKSNPNQSPSEAIAFLNGGPGGASIDTAPKLLLEAAELFGFPFLIIDYRGMGRSGALSCDSLKTGIRTALEARSCMWQIGQRSRFYSTESIVRDLEITRATLRIKRLSLYGASYGTIVAQTYTALFPKRLGAVVLDSPVPLNNDPWGQTQFPSFARIIRLKNVHSKSNAKQLRHNLHKVLRQLRSSPSLQSRTNLDGRKVFEIYQTANASFDDAIQLAARDQNYRTLIEMSALLNTIPPLTPVEVEVFSQAASYAVWCNDMVSTVPWRPAARIRERSNQLWRALYRDVPRYAFAPFSRVEAFDLSIQLCTGFPYPQITPTTLRANTNAPILTLFGDQDEVTPIEYVPELQAVFKRKVAIARNTGHVVAFNSCGLSLIAEFFKTKTVRNI